MGKFTVILPAILLALALLLLSGCAYIGERGSGLEEMPEAELRELCGEQDLPQDCDVIPDAEGKALCEKCEALLGYVKGKSVEGLSESELRGECAGQSWPPSCDMVSDEEGRALCEKCMELEEKGAAAEELSIPAGNIANCVGFLYYGPEEGATISLIGAGWGRPHPGPFAWGFVEKARGEYDFSGADEWVRAAQEDGIALLATVWPYADWDQGDCHSKECEVSYADIFYPTERGGAVDGIPRSRCMPCDIGAYKDFLGALVERYDGDGIDDMAGIELPVKYWEVLNEPAMASDELTFFKGTEEEYVELLKASNGAVKGACEGCVVVQGGAMGISGDALAFWGNVFDLGGADYFDIANIHYINFGDASTLNVKDFKELMESKGVDKPIWVTEAEFGSASGVVSSFGGALDAGAEKVFFTRFEIGKEGPPVPGKYSAVYEGIAEKCRQ